jgi:maltose O-acetyltransferase
MFVLANIILTILPPTRCFRVKRLVLRLCGIRVGARTQVCGGTKFFGSGRITIGSDVWVGLGTKFYLTQAGEINIGDRCDIAPEVSFITGSHEIAGVFRRAGRGLQNGINIGPGTWIGARALVLGGCRTGAACVIGASATLLGKEYPSDSLIVGCPGKVLRRLAVE